MMPEPPTVTPAGRYLAVTVAFLGWLSDRVGRFWQVTPDTTGKDLKE